MICDALGARVGLEGGDAKEFKLCSSSPITYDALGSQGWAGGRGGFWGARS